MELEWQTRYPFTEFTTRLRFWVTPDFASEFDRDCDSISNF